MKSLSTCPRKRTPVEIQETISRLPLIRHNGGAHNLARMSHESTPWRDYDHFGILDLSFQIADWLLSNARRGIRIQ